MSRDSITLNTQLTALTRAGNECHRLQHRLSDASQQITDAREQRDEELATLTRQNETFLADELQRVSNEATNRLENLRLDINSQVDSVKERRDRQIEDLLSGLNEQVQQLQEQKDSETWVLQSVYDENSTDSPAAHFDREAETFVTQKDFLDSRFGSLQEQINHTKQFLSECHSAVGQDESIPPSDIANGLSRSKLRDLAIESSDLALTEAGRLEQRSLPQWIRGWRLWGGGLLGFVLLLVPVLLIKADLRAFLNPEISNPDWNWLAVSAFIALTVVVLFSTVLVLIVQSKLRAGFDVVMQHMANAQLAKERWERKSELNLDRMEKAAEAWFAEIELRRESSTKQIQQKFDTQIAELRLQTSTQTAQLRNEVERTRQQLEQQQEHSEQQIASWQQQEELRIRTVAEEQFQQAVQSCNARFESVTRNLQSQCEETLAAWRTRVADVKRLTQMSQTLVSATTGWPPLTDGHWSAPEQMPTALPIADLLVTLPRPPESLTDQTSASLCVEMPAILRFPGDTSLVVEHDSASRETALSFLRTQLLKLLTIIPPGRIRLTLIDPVGLGQSFSAMMHLADFDELLIHSRIWTDSSQIRDQLQKVTEHMENVFQTYLRSEFDSIEEYNQSAGEVAEPYHFVVVAGFPTAFSEEAARHLSSILTSGPRCGVHALVAWNPAVAAPPSFDPDDLTNSCIRFVAGPDNVQPHQAFAGSVLFEQFPEPPADQYVRLVRAVGEASKDARRVEVSFNRIAPRNDDIWSHSTADGIDLPIGRAGAARLQFMRLGRGTSQHVLVAGKTGSGKSTLLHILITNLALYYSPDEIQFYLIDFKKGVEFKTYAAHKLPHARVVAIESDREFGLSVLERLDAVLQERGELFRSRGVQDVPSFREQFPTEPMPRLLLLIDEFQEFFVAEDRVSSRASLLLDRLIRQGRAFGIHVLLGSQTLGGAYSLARSTMGQVAVRIALQCSESDAHLILSEDNSAARLLTRPGEAIYNDANGLVEGNHPFQIAWLDEARREQAIATMLDQSTYRTDEYPMVVFEGNVAPTVDLCGPLNAQLSNTIDMTRRQSDAMQIWLGEPVAIAAPTHVELRRASGQNLLIVGQDESMADCILAMTTLSTCLPATAAADTADAGPKLILLHSDRQSDSRDAFQHLVKLAQVSRCRIGVPAECKQTIEEIHAEVVRREDNAESANGEELVLIVRNLGQFRELRREEDDFGLGGIGESKPATTASLFGDIIKRGPLVGVHVVLWADTFSNATRWLSTSLLREFENRIAFRMNQTDSASLVDTPVAASLGPGRAILYRDQTGTTEKFRPFSWPADNWLRSLVVEQNPPPQDDLDIDSLTIE
jgi:energy-coupling factor transporter ATP-binding protein EcfA2